jgi:hypothetical protein
VGVFGSTTALAQLSGDGKSGFFVWGLKASMPPRRVRHDLAGSRCLLPCDHLGKLAGDDARRSCRLLLPKQQRSVGAGWLSRQRPEARGAPADQCRGDFDRDQTKDRPPV